MKLIAPLAFAVLSLGTLAASPLSVHRPVAQHPQDGPGNIVEVATEAGSFGTLLAAAKAAGLVDALTGQGPLTVLAPTDEAFEALGKETIANLLKPENRETLKTILTYHVISGKVEAKDALRAGSAATLAGPEVSFSLVGGKLLVNGEVSVLANDIAASNGVIHVINEVLIPPTPKPEGRLVVGFFSERPGEELARYLGVDRNATLLVSSVTKGSEAEAAGLRAYDLIVGVNGRAATSEVIGEEKEKAGYGGAIHLDILRKGQKMTVDAKVGVEEG
ncbi:Immunogenic protein MPT70 precursor [Planctomycetes bacterium Poly30]|uniref:Immunogenic protein MPT70 n=1 Tax=Saltatorellus ferox TaxID=2528018 RepID=A0A518ENC3_9BACT|nr:Immunogenic protein MPT70 precursor [Planctomycetes bacterium Poly30]